MASDEIHVGDVGTVIQGTIREDGTPVDISAATTQEFVFQKPDGTTFTRATSFVTDGVDGKIKYALQAGDIDVAGDWAIQGHVVLPSEDYKTDIAPFIVFPNL